MQTIGRGGDVRWTIDVRCDERDSHWAGVRAVRSLGSRKERGCHRSIGVNLRSSCDARAPGLNEKLSHVERQILDLDPTHIEDASSPGHCWRIKVKMPSNTKPVRTIIPRIPG